MLKLSIIIPAYNESASVRHTAFQLKPVFEILRKKYDTEIIFINDGSNDETFEKLSEAFRNQPSVRIIDLPAHRGLGEALRHGFRAASGDIIVTTDFDGTYDFRNIPLLIEQLIKENAGIVTASPYHPEGVVDHVPVYRLIFSRSASFLYRILIDHRIHTWTSLFRAYKREVVKAVEFQSDGFLAVTELLVNALKAGYQVSEFPAALKSRAFGNSNLRVLSVTLTHLRFMTRLLISRKKPACFLPSVKTPAFSASESPLEKKIGGSVGRK